MKVVTWNINRFDGVWDWYNNGDLPMPQRKECANKITEKLSELLTTMEDIAILQEVPYRGAGWKDEWNEHWKSFLNERFKVMLWFDNEPERKDFNYSSSKNVTIAITKKGSNWAIRSYESRAVKFGETNGCSDYVNRYIELVNGNMSLLGFHLSSYKDGGEEQWKQIHSVADSSMFSFIVGDFNVNDFLYPFQNDLRRLEKNYDRMIDKDVITQNQTLASLDNIFVKKGLCSNTKISILDYCYIPKCDGFGDSVRQMRCSDHHACICEIYKIY